MMTGPITVDTTAGGIQILDSNNVRRSAVLENRGSIDAYIKYDGSATALTASNGQLLRAGQTMTITADYICGTQDAYLGYADMRYAIKAIVASGSTTIIANEV